MRDAQFSPNRFYYSDLFIREATSIFGKACIRKHVFPARNIKGFING